MMLETLESAVLLQDLVIHRLIRETSNSHLRSKL